MKRRLALAASLCSLGLFVGVVSRRRRAERYPTLRVVGSQRAPHVPRSTTVAPLLAPIVLARIMLAFGFPGWDDITGVFKSVAKDVKDFVVRAVSDAIDWAIAGVKLVISAVEGALNELRQAFLDFKDAIYSITDGIRSLAWSLWDSARQYTRWYADLAVAGLHDIAQPLIDLGQLAGGWIATAFTQAINWSSEHIYWPLWNLIQQTVAWVNTEIIGRVGRMIADAFGNIWGMVNWLWQQVPAIIDWIENVAKIAIDIVWRARGFLTFVITHPFDWWLILLRDIASKAPQWIIRNIEGAVADHGSMLEDWAVKALG